MAGRHLVALRGDEAALCREHHAALRRVVTRRVRMSPDLVEDACQHAWLIMMRRQPQRGPTLFGWLCTVAIREGYRLAARQARNASLDEVAFDGGEPDAVAPSPAAAHVAEQRLEAREALLSVASLPAKQRRYVVLRVARLSYREIAERERVTYTNVDKHLAKARRRLRKVRDQAA